MPGRFLSEERMTKQEFLTELQRALTNHMSVGAVAGHVNYYREYIEVEVRKGKSEEQVVAELGNPRLIAKSILNASADEAKKIHLKKERGTNASAAGIADFLARLPRWVWILLGIVVVLILGVFLTSLAGILLPVLLPLILIFLLIRWWNRSR